MAAEGALSDVYRDRILEHARQPRCFGVVEGATHSADGINSVCGDRLHIELKLEGPIIKEVGFTGTGCAISIASASLMTDELTGLNISDARVVSARLQKALNDTGAEVDLGELTALLGVRKHPSRVKCAALAWVAMEKAIDESGQTVTTE